MAYLCILAKLMEFHEENFFLYIHGCYEFSQLTRFPRSLTKIGPFVLESMHIEYLAQHEFLSKNYYFLNKKASLVEHELPWRFISEHNDFAIVNRQICHKYLL
jgi:hypothetical protein